MHEEILNKKKKNILKFRTMGNFQGRYKHGTRQKWFCFPNNQRVSFTRSVPLALRTLWDFSMCFHTGSIQKHKRASAPGRWQRHCLLEPQPGSVFPVALCACLVAKALSESVRLTLSFSSLWEVLSVPWAFRTTLFISRLCIKCVLMWNYLCFFMITPQAMCLWYTRWLMLVVNSLD